MSLKQVCSCGHDIDTHFRDLQTGRREACLGMRCDCQMYDEGNERRTPLLPPNNFDESKTAAGGGRPHFQCHCQRCWEWDMEQARRFMPSF